MVCVVTVGPDLYLLLKIYVKLEFELILIRGSEPPVLEDVVVPTIFSHLYVVAIELKITDAELVVNALDAINSNTGVDVEIVSC